MADPRPGTAFTDCVQTRWMVITRLSPEALHRTAGYAHVTIVDAGRLAMLAGQCPLDRNGNLVGRGELLAQIDQIVANSTVALAAADASAEDVVRAVISVVSEDPRARCRARGTVSPALASARHL
jgi:enamine deaminase RidA (YjgF/YER057c/UK114 family)